jgi:hypothetical protein
MTGTLGYPGSNVCPEAEVPVTEQKRKFYGTEVLKQGSSKPGRAKEYFVEGGNGLGLTSVF